MAKGPTAVTQSLSLMLIVMLSFLLVGGSFLLKMNWGTTATASDMTIDYAYQNEGPDPQKRNHYRRIKIVITSITSLSALTTKNIRVSVFREGEYGEPGIQNGKVFSIVLEDMAKFKSVIFDYKKCVIVGEEMTDIVILLFKQYDDEIALKSMIVNIDRQTDKITLLGKEVTASDIWANTDTNADLANHKIPLDKGYLQILLGGARDKNNNR